MEQSDRITSKERIARASNVSNTHKKDKNKDKDQLAADLRIALEELENARRYFEVVDDPELIEYAIYCEKAALSRVSYLLKKARSK